MDPLRFARAAAQILDENTNGSSPVSLQSLCSGLGIGLAKSPMLEGLAKLEYPGGPSLPARITYLAGAPSELLRVACAACLAETILRPGVGVPFVFPAPKDLRTLCPGSRQYKPFAAHLSCAAALLMPPCAVEHYFCSGVNTLRHCAAHFCVPEAFAKKWLACLDKL